MLSKQEVLNKHWLGNLLIILLVNQEIECRIYPICLFLLSPGCQKQLVHIITIIIMYVICLYPCFSFQTVGFLSAVCFCILQLYGRTSSCYYYNSKTDYLLSMCTSNKLSGLGTFSLTTLSPTLRGSLNSRDIKFQGESPILSWALSSEIQGKF